MRRELIRRIITSAIPLLEPQVPRRHGNQRLPLGVAERDVGVVLSGVDAESVLLDGRVQAAERVRRERIQVELAGRAGRGRVGGLCEVVEQAAVRGIGTGGGFGGGEGRGRDRGVEARAEEGGAEERPAEGGGRHAGGVVRGGCRAPEVFECKAAEPRLKKCSLAWRRLSAAPGTATAGDKRHTSMCTPLEDSLS